MGEGRSTRSGRGHRLAGRLRCAFRYYSRLSLSCAVVCLTVGVLILGGNPLARRVFLFPLESDCSMFMMTSQLMTIFVESDITTERVGLTNIHLSCNHHWLPPHRFRTTWMNTEEHVPFQSGFEVCETNTTELNYNSQLCFLEECITPRKTYFSNTLVVNSLIEWPLRNQIHEPTNLNKKKT